LEVELDGSAGPALVGSKASLVSAFQAKSGSRIVFSGSVDMFTDAFMTEESGNEGFARDVTAWCFQEEGVLRIDKVLHRKVGEDTPREQYQIGMELVRTYYSFSHWLV